MPVVDQWPDYAKSQYIDWHWVQLKKKFKGKEKIFFPHSHAFIFLSISTFPVRKWNEPEFLCFVARNNSCKGKGILPNSLPAVFNSRKPCVVLN